MSEFVLTRAGCPLCAAGATKSVVVNAKVNGEWCQVVIPREQLEKLMNNAKEMQKVQADSTTTP